jgi:hypothetical protein
MYNKKLLLTVLKDLNKAKKPTKKKDINYDATGKGMLNKNYAGKPVRLATDTLYNPTPYRINAKSDNGIEQTLEPYDETTVNFPGANYIDEYPEMKKGGGFSRNLLATNRLFKKNTLFKKNPLTKPNKLFKKKSYKRKTYDPMSMYFQDGGYIETELTPEEIEQYKKGGYIVEDISIPSLNKFAPGGANKGCPPGQYWNGTKCTKLYTLKNDKKYIDGVANWAMHASDPNMISGNYNDQIKDRLYSGKWGFDPESGALVRLDKIQPQSVTTLDAKTKASREKEKLTEQNYKAEEENKKAYEKSITDAGFDPATFGKAKGVNTITGEPIYASSKEEADKINQEAINQAAIEGHAAVVNNPVFKAGAYMTPVGMAIGAMEGLARFVPDAATFAQDPTLANAGQLGMDVAQVLPFAKPIANTFKINPKIKSNTTFYKSKNTGTNTSTGLTEADIAAARAEEEAWLTSDEYLKRRMANTGETAEQVKKDVDAIIKRADKATYNVNANLSGAHGEMSTNLFMNPKVSVSSTAPNPKAVLRHENIHLHSPASKNKSILGTDLHKGWDNPDVANLPASERGVYANYPTIGDAPESLAYSDPDIYNYNMLGYEQQARQLGAMRDIAAKNNVNLNAGEKLTEQQVRSHLDDFAKTRKDVDYDYDATWSAEVNKEQLRLADELGISLDKLKESNPTKYKEVMTLAKDNAAKTITNVLNNAWVTVPTAGAVGTATILANPFEGSDGLQQQQYGGVLKRFINGGEEDCPKGYMRSYDGKCVPSPISEQAADEEWYRNWYANRVIQDEEGQKLLDDARSKILKRAEKFPETTWYSEPGSSTYGSFEPLTGELRLNSDALDGNPFLRDEVEFHEKGHYLTSPNMMDPETDTVEEVVAHPIQHLRNYETNIVDQALKSRKDIPRKDRDHYDYMKGVGEAQPYTEEISKNLMQLRRLAGFKPDQVVTEEDINNLYKKADEKGWTDPNSDFFVEPFLNLINYTKDTEQLKTLFNKLAKNEPEQVDDFQPQQAQYGGALSKFIGGGSPCDDGYTYDPKLGCIPLSEENMTEDQKWMVDWYKNRKIQFPEDQPSFKKVVEKVLPAYNPESPMLEQMQSFPVYETMPKEYMQEDIGGFPAAGMYDTSGKVPKIYFNPELTPEQKSDTERHELTNYLMEPVKDKLYPMYNKIVEENIIPFDENWPKEKQDFYDYVIDPEEQNIQSYLNVARKKFNLKADEVITPERLNQMREEAEKKGMLDKDNKNFNQDIYLLFKMAKDDEGLMKWFNLIAKKDSNKDDIQYGKYGGSLGYQLGDEIDETTMNELKRLGYTFEEL